MRSLQVAIAHLAFLLGGLLHLSLRNNLIINYFVYLDKGKESYLFKARERDVQLNMKAKQLFVHHLYCTCSLSHCTSLVR